MSSRKVIFSSDLILFALLLIANIIDLYFRFATPAEERTSRDVAQMIVHGGMCLVLLGTLAPAEIRNFWSQRQTCSESDALVERIKRFQASFHETTCA